MSTRPQSPRAHDVVLWGATGFTGALVAEELARRYTGALRFALAGRSREKLEGLRTKLAAIEPRAADVPIIVADANDRESLMAMVRAARVIATTVGPYARYGHELVAACAVEGTSYCDLTGEPHFVRECIDRHHERARETGARIVNACGFDSIPSDLGAYMMQRHAASLGTRCVAIQMHVARLKGGLSGGTFATMLDIAETMQRDRDVRRVLRNPYGLDPDPSHHGPDGPDQRSVRFDREHGYTAPFFMAVMNTRVVRRTNALFGYAWGEDFRYSEASSVGRGPRGLARATAMTAGLGAFFGAASVAPLRKLLAKRVLPAPGEGPSEEQRERGKFEFRFYGTTAEGKKLFGVVGDRFDPGYGSTARMFAASAACLALDSLESEPGVLTPAYAMREHFIERARAIGMRFEVAEERAE